MHKLYCQISEILMSVVKNNCSIGDLNTLIYFCQKLASERIKQLIRYGRINPALITSSVELIAFDSIAELFKRDEDGNLTEFKHHFCIEIDITELTQEEIFRELRILIFQKLNHNIFRLYSEADPILSKIIRHLKYKIRSSDKFTEIERFGDIYIYNCKTDELEMHLPEFGYEELSELVSGQNIDFSKEHNIPERVFSLINRQNKCRRTISLLNLALCCKTIIARYPLPFSAIIGDDKNISGYEINHFLKNHLCFANLQLKPRFVDKGKISAELYESYFSAINDMLLQSVSESGDGLPAHDYLRKYITSLTPATYRSEHREKFEYLLKLTKNILKERITDIL